MLQESITILAVNPGTKYIGLAVFQAPDLAYWGIKVLKGKWSEGKIRSAELALETLIDRYHVDVLVLKKLHSSRSSHSLDCLAASIRKLARRKKIKLSVYFLPDLKVSLGVGMRGNKMAIAGIVTARYPFLIHELERERKHKHPYFVRMFEAIAAGIFWFNDCGSKYNCKIAK